MGERTFVVTGSASGMGAALVSRLEAEGARVIGIDRHDADICANLGLPEGRRAATAQIAELAPDGIDAAATFAGLSGHAGVPGSAVVSVDYFGTVDLLNSLRPLLSTGGGGAAVVIGSIGATIHPGVSSTLVDACLHGEEATAADLADALGPPDAYVAAKLAVARWARRSATQPEWIGAGIRLNAIAPGMVETPMVDQARAEANGRAVVAEFPLPIGRAGLPEEIAAVAAFLLGPETRFLVGSVITVDGGTEAALVPDSWPTALDTAH